MTQYVRENIDRIETPILTWALIGVTGLFLVAYAFFINGTIQNAVAKSALEDQISSISSRLSSVEAEYLSLKKDLSPALAESLGFHEPSKASTIYVTYRSGDVGITFNR
ncbi:MAG: hypothetical protein WC767_01120 [Candidatus Paceibacterota bacterium]|jgi:hypothetical protein